MTLNRETVEVGEDVQADVSVANSCGARAVDLYVVFILPQTAAPILGCSPGILPLAFVADGGSSFGVRCASASVATFPPYAANAILPGGINVTVHDVLGFTWPAGAPLGIYTLAIVATPPGAFQDGMLDPADILAIGLTAWPTSPGRRRARRTRVLTCACLPRTAQERGEAPPESTPERS